MFYVVDGSVYSQREDGKFVNVEIVGKDKVIVTRQLESVTVNEGDIVIDDIGDAIPMTLDHIVAKFNVNEENPVPFAKPKKSRTKKKASAEDDF